MILRMLVRKGVNHGIRRASRGGKPTTPGQRQGAQANRTNAKRVNQAMRVARRFGRF
ncbi:hypothetical protein [Oceanicola granulosus]|nr:hypothetical protein [Oceanicola granulosus]